MKSSPGSDGFTEEFYQIIRKKYHQYCTICSRIQKRRKRFSFFVKLVPPWQQTRQRRDKERKLYTNIFHKYRHKNLCPDISKRTQQYIRIIIYCDQVEFILGMQGRLNIKKISLSVIHHINRLKMKNMVISIHTENTSDKIRQLFKIFKNPLRNIGIEKDFFIQLRASIKKPYS